MYHFEFLSDAGNSTFEHESYIIVVLSLIINVIWLLLTILGIDISFTGLFLAFGFVLIARELDKNFYTFNSGRINTSTWEIRMIRIGTNLISAFVALVLNGALGMTILMQSPKGLISFLSTWLSQLGLLGMGRLYFLGQELIGEIQTEYYKTLQPQPNQQKQSPQQNSSNQATGQQMQRSINPNPIPTQGQGILDINSLVNSAVANALAGGVQSAMAQGPANANALAGGIQSAIAQDPATANALAGGIQSALAQAPSNVSINASSPNRNQKSSAK